MQSLFRQFLPSSSVRRSVWNPAPVIKTCAVLTVLLIGWSAYKAYTSGMLWLALIQLALTLADIIAVAPVVLHKEQEKAWRRVMTIFCLSLCVDLLRLR